MLDILLIVALLILAGGGYKIAVAGLEIYDNSLAKAMALPIGLISLIGITTLLAPWLPLWGCLLSCLLLFAIIGLALKTPQVQGATPPPFSRGQKLLLFITVSASLFYVHSVQLLTFAPDFCSFYPISRSLIKSGLPVIHPFFPWISLNGHFSKELLIGTLAGAVGQDTIRATWICEIFLLISGIMLWALVIRKISHSARAGAWGAFFLFFCVNVGGKAGLMDAFDNGDLLVFTILGLLLGLFVDIIYKAREHWPLHWPKIVLTTVLAGLYGFICESYLALVLACFAAGSLIVCRRRTSIAKTLLSITALSILGSLSISICGGGVLGSLVRQRAHQLWAIPDNRQTDRQTEVGPTSDYASISFPKRHLLAIRLGADPYQRFSSALNTALFRHYKPVLDDGGYSSIFSLKVLVLHWIPTWLAPLTLAWAIRRRSICGYMFGLLGLIAYLTPALIDFGPIQEAQYFRWEFASGVGFAGLMALALADLIDYSVQLKSRSWRRLIYSTLLVFVIANIVGAQKLLNNIIIEAQKSPQAAAKVLWPWYPNTYRWLLSCRELQLNQRDLDLALWLWQQPGCKNIVWREHDYTPQQFLKCAVINGLAGTLSCEHALPPHWQPMGTAPYLPNGSTVAFQKEPSWPLISGLGANWLVSEKPLPEGELGHFSSANSSVSPTIKPIATLVRTFGGQRQYWLYKLANSLPPKGEVSPSPAAQPPIQIKVTGLPAAGSWMYGQAYPISLSYSQPLKGWLQASFKGQTNRPDQGRLTDCPFTFWVEGSNSRVMLSPPLDEGHYLLSWSYSPDGKDWQRLEGQTQADYLVSENIDENLRVKEIVTTSANSGFIILKNIGNRPFDCGGPLSIKWWVWSDYLHNYRTGAATPEGETIYNQTIPPQGEIKVNWQTQEPISPNGSRLDISASAKIGQNVTVSRFF